MRGRPRGSRNFRSLSTYHPEDEPILGDMAARRDAAAAGSLSLLLAYRRYFERRAAA